VKKKEKQIVRQHFVSIMEILLVNHSHRCILYTIAARGRGKMSRESFSEIDFETSKG